jgi:Zn-dependent protease with chaperone function
MTKRATIIKAAMLVSLLAAAAPVPAPAAEKVKVHGYLDFRKGSYLIVDAQRLEVTSKTKFSGEGEADGLGCIPLGYEIKAKGKRRDDGTVVVRRLEARPNGTEKFEFETLALANAAEGSYASASEIYEEKENGKHKKIGALTTTGPEADRARGIIDRLLPAYVDPDAVRVYIVDNPDWNAMAMANFSIYVYSGLMSDLDDDELAIVLGHEVTHATYEHSRRQAAKGNVASMALGVAMIAATGISNDYARTATELGLVFVGDALCNSFRREFEDQADRVGLRYVYEAGYDDTKAPELWDRFAEKYGVQGNVTNFFFGDHSTHAQRARDLATEIRNNYGDPGRDPPSHPASAPSGR